VRDGKPFAPVGRSCRSALIFEIAQTISSWSSATSSAINGHSGSFALPDWKMAFDKVEK
jgi:hypothetical protein